MPINFPNSPALNETYTFNTITWIWNGYGWDLFSSGSGGGVTGSIVGPYVQSINGLTGIVTNVAFTNSEQTFSSNVNILGNLNISGSVLVDGPIVTKTAFYGFTGDADEEPLDYVTLDGGIF
jgi:hypothetical protein